MKIPTATDTYQQVVEIISVIDIPILPEDFQDISNLQTALRADSLSLPVKPMQLQWICIAAARWGDIIAYHTDGANGWCDIGYVGWPLWSMWLKDDPDIAGLRLQFDELPVEA